MNKADYRKKIREALERGDIPPVYPGGRVKTEVWHDDDCQYFETGNCTCTPEILVIYKPKKGKK